MARPWAINIYTTHWTTEKHDSKHIVLKYLDKILQECFCDVYCTNVYLILHKIIITLDENDAKNVDILRKYILTPRKSTNSQKREWEKIWYNFETSLDLLKSYSPIRNWDVRKSRLWNKIVNLNSDTAPTNPHPRSPTIKTTATIFS